MQEETVTLIEEGWTFVIDSILAKSTGGEVTGWFLYYRLNEHQTDTGRKENLVTRYLNDLRNPITLKVPPEFYTDEDSNKPFNYEIGTDDVYDGMANIFSKNYGEIPKPSLSIPLHEIPPSMRDGLMKTMGHE